ncbi:MULTISPECIES: hypothetical protein [unclassified Prevotella]|uniref:hypothetical protein n=1 Tax=unclassified Prevotella TaxID=2638335 RepID=UPI00048BB551|nr:MULTISPECIES: hypothetical protein [unclassified Prevotella]
MKRINKLNKTVTVNGMMAVTKSELEMDYVQFLPDNPSVGQMDAFRGRGLGQLLSNGSFEFIRTKRLRRKPEFRGCYASLSFGGDGFDRVTFVVPNALRTQLPTILRKGICQIISHLVKKGWSK